MAEANIGPEKYAGNANRDKAPLPPEKPKVEKVVSGEVTERKRPLGRRIRDSFTSPTAEGTGSYLVFDVILPRVKDLIFDIGESALRRTLFGDTAKGYSPRGSSGRGYTPYNTIASSAVPKQQASKFAAEPPSDEFGEIVVPSRGEAEAVMDKMGNLIENFGQASVSDLKAATGLTGRFTDERFGWTTMGGTDIRRVGGTEPGYLLIFPRPMELP